MLQIVNILSFQFIKLTRNTNQSHSSISLLQLIYLLSLLMMIFIDEIDAKRYSDNGTNQNSTNRFLSNTGSQMCSCGMGIFQQKFCEHDFVFIAKKVNLFETPFDRIDDLPRRGVIIRFRLLYSLKGSIFDYRSRRQFLSIYVVRDLCGTNRKFPKHRRFLISGFKFNNKLVISGCSIVKSMNELYGTQISGLFNRKYQNYCYSHNKCKISISLNPVRLNSRYTSMQFAKIEKFHSRINNCNFNYRFKDCYERYSICEYQTSDNQSTCGFITSPSTLLLSSSTNQLSTSLTSLPMHLRKKIATEKIYSDIFSICIAVKISNSN